MRATASWLLVGFLVVGSVSAGADPPAASADRVRPLLAGTEIPNVTLTGVDGKPFDLRAAVAKKPAVLIFYRGGW